MRFYKLLLKFICIESGNIDCNVKRRDVFLRSYKFNLKKCEILHRIYKFITHNIIMTKKQRGIYTMKIKKFNLYMIQLLLATVMAFSIPTVCSAATKDNILAAYAVGEAVYPGGMPIGVTINLDGLLVTDVTGIATSTGNMCPAKDCGVNPGDILLSANGIKLEKSSQLTEIVEKNSDIVLSVKRGSYQFTTIVSPVIDCISGNKKLGLFVRNNTSGIGTMTYMRSDGSYGALGHPIINSATGEIIEVKSGKLYESKILGLTKGRSGKAGELKGMIKRECGEIGTVDENTPYGIYGTLTKKMTNDISDEPMTAAGRTAARCGKAKILTTIEGEKPKFYDIEIVKCVKQKKKSEKGLVLKVTDKELIEKSGGIVQGMSGSPIFQNDKLIGAVTHVFINDPTRGYGIYIDFML